MEINVENIIQASYIRMYKVLNLDGNYYFMVTTDRHWGAAMQPIGLRGYEILGRAYDSNRTIDRSNGANGAICYTIYNT